MADCKKCHSEILIKSDYRFKGMFSKQRKQMWNLPNKFPNQKSFVLEFKDKILW